MTKKVCVWGGGWSGLTAALELSESENCEVHIYEASDSLGGKILGSVNEKKISTHAIRLISEYYPAFADICSRIPTENKKTLLDRWSPISYFNFYASQKNKKHFINRQLSKSTSGNLTLLKAVLFTFELSIKDVYKVYKAIKKFRSLNEAQIKELDTKKESVEEYLKVYNLSEKAQYFLFTYLGITVAARPTSTASMSLDLMSKMFVGVHRSEHLNIPSKKDYRNWVIDGPLGDRLLPPFLEELQRRGVFIHTNKGLASFNEQDSKIAFTNTGEEVVADAHILALNNKVIEKLGFGRQELSLENEWSIGGIIPLPKIPTSLQLENYKSVVAVMDSAWAIVFVVWRREQENGLWSNDVVFPEGAEAMLEFVVCRLEDVGTHGKTFFESTPIEASSEVLQQIGLSKETIKDLAPTCVFSDCLSYTNALEKDALSLYSKPNKDGFYWKLYAPIYTSSPETLPLNIETAKENIFLCGEAVAASYQYIKTPTLELSSETAKDAVQKTFNYLGLTQKVYQEYPDRFSKRQS